MSIQQPLGTDPLNIPDHALSHRVFANDGAAPVQSVVVDASGNTSLGSYNLTTTGLGTFGSLKITTSPTAGYVLTSDVDGNATWQLATVSADWGSITGTQSDVSLSGFTNDLTAFGKVTFGSTYQAVLGDDTGLKAGTFTSPTGEMFLGIDTSYFGTANNTGKEAGGSAYYLQFLASNDAALKASDSNGNLVNLATGSNGNNAIYTTGTVSFNKSNVGSTQSASLSGAYFNPGADGYAALGNFYDSISGNTALGILGYYPSASPSFSVPAGYYGVLGYTLGTGATAGYFTNIASGNIVILGNDTYAIDATGQQMWQPMAQPTGTASGQFYFDSSTNSPQYYNGLAWVDLAAGGGTWVRTLSGDSVTYIQEPIDMTDRILIGGAIDDLSSNLQVGGKLQITSFYSSGDAYPAIQVTDTSIGRVFGLIPNADNFPIGLSGGTKLIIGWDNINGGNIDFGTYASIGRFPDNALHFTVQGSGMDFQDSMKILQYGGVMIPDRLGSYGTDDTTSALQVNGTINATAFTGDGSGITNVSYSESDPYFSNWQSYPSLSNDLAMNNYDVNGVKKIIFYGGGGTYPYIDGSVWYGDTSGYWSVSASNRQLGAGDSATVMLSWPDSTNGLHILELATAPASPSEGAMYYDTATHKPNYHNGTSWVTGLVTGDATAEIDALMASLTASYWATSNPTSLVDALNRMASVASVGGTVPIP